MVLFDVRPYVRLLVGQNLNGTVDVSRRDLRQPVHDAEGIERLAGALQLKLRSSQSPSFL